MRRMKTLIFIIVFLLVLAVTVNLLVDMQSQRKEIELSSNREDPFSQNGGQIIPTLSPAASPAPSFMPTAAPAATLSPVVTPTPTLTPVITPEPTPTPLPTPTPIPVGEIIGGGSFASDTGVPINVRADWYAVVESEEYVKVTVDVYLESYQINVIAVNNAVNVMVGGDYRSAGAPEIKWDQNVKIDTLLSSTEHLVPLRSGMAESFPLAVEYHFGGVYSGQDLPVIECGGSIWLAR